MKYKIRLNGTVYEVEVEKGNAQLLREYEAVSAPAEAKASSPVTEAVPVPVAATGGRFITAPLPGTVTEIRVSVGQKIAAGEIVGVIEAMKMQNEVAASEGGTVAAIIATKGAQIQSGEPFVQLA